jgi:hypothetical protein
MTAHQRRQGAQTSLDTVSDMHSGFAAARDGSHCLTTQSEAWQEGWRLFWQSSRHAMPRVPHTRTIRNWKHL